MVPASILCLLLHGVSTAAEKPNVLFISIDDLNDWTGCLGGHPNAITPHIDRLAKRGVLFTNAHCQAPVCTPSRASLVTSRLPSSTRLYFLQPHLHVAGDARGSVTLVERFANEGYKTLGVGKIYGGHDERYFQKYGGKFGGFGPRPKEKISYPIGHPLWDWGAYPESDDQMPDTKIADWGINQLQQKHDKPFFLAVGFFRPHVPMFAPKKWFDQHPLKQVQLPKIDPHDRDDLPQYGKDLTIGHPAPRHEWFIENRQWKHAVQSYLASTTFVDHCMGRVLDALDHSEYAKNTVILLFSDHGWHLGEKERWAKRSLWEDSTRVPMIVAGPKIKPGISARSVGLIDIYPTLLDLCDLKADSAHEGKSLTPLLENPGAEWNRPVITTFGPNNHAVRSDRWRYIRYADGSEELYDHKTDPHEWHNLAADKKYAKVINNHAKWLPRINKPYLTEPGSSGLEAFLEAEKSRKQREQ
ncbi:MAG: sulfatase [Planctomycetes bacterium]|nr:sulfatase [Planctomycetota bacterium]